MSTTRLINVFWREDGAVLYSETWGSGALPTVPKQQERSPKDAPAASVLSSAGSKSGATETVSASTVWSLVQVFIQFAREVGGGNVQRLIFRDPVQPDGKPQAFGAAPTGVPTATRRPVLIHVANDELFAVTVTEALPAETSQLHRLKDAFPAGIFVHEALLYVAMQQSSFLNRESPPSAEGAQIAQARARGVAESSPPAVAPAARGGVVTSRADVQRSYVSDTSDSGSFASPSLSSSQGSFSSSAEDNLRAADENDVDVTPMMTFEYAVLRTELQRIADSLTSP